MFIGDEMALNKIFIENWGGKVRLTSIRITEVRMEWLAAQGCSEFWAYFWVSHGLGTEKVDLAILGLRKTFSERHTYAFMLTDFECYEMVRENLIWQESHTEKIASKYHKGH